ncbi:thiolase family protein [Halorientalis regularis]|uniref:Acetyl-CoA C-acetyltransferase/acetyl-CoA acyltransferase n=1 Tax=Halorientalis regularis TaxID=660518 RepID=A0A1G7PVU5_9EURY|nr:thiolase family protein [Halorientalis regularis]SDF90442.1 acetyl-CoA C-acetyltransferase/acetyl-CoA acyltransferase [Halorientalis regularis]
MSRRVLAEGVSAVPNGSYDVPTWQLAAGVLTGAVDDAGLDLDDVDGLYLPKPRPWTEQGFFSTSLANRLGLHLDRNVETYTGGTSGGSAFRLAARDVASGTLDVAVVFAAERNSTVETDDYLAYVLETFDHDIQAPAGPTVPGIYAQSLQRYRHEYDVPREAIADIAVKNHGNGASNPEGLFSSGTTVTDVLDSRPIARPLRLYECPAPCDGAAAVVLASEAAASAATVEVAGTGYDHPPSQYLGTREGALTEHPAFAGAADEALGAAGLAVADVDAFELYAPFPHTEAILTEELGLFERGRGALAAADGATAVDGPTPISPSGGPLGRGHPAMVTPILNHVEAVRQLRGTAANQVANADVVLTSAEHGHVDGVNTTVFRGGIDA